MATQDTNMDFTLLPNRWKFPPYAKISAVMESRPGSVRDCFKDCLALNYETFNIWSHLLPLLASVVIGIYDSTQVALHWLCYLSLGTQLFVFTASSVAHIFWRLPNPLVGKVLFFIDWFAILFTVTVLQMSMTYITLAIYDHRVLFWIYSTIGILLNAGIALTKLYLDFIRQEPISSSKQYVIISFPNIFLGACILGNAYADNKSFLFKEPALYVPFWANQGLLVWSVLIHLVARFPEGFIEWGIADHRWSARWLSRVKLLGHSHHWWHLYSSAYLIWNYYQVKNWEPYFIE